jgi:hypothetical protein
MIAALAPKSFMQLGLVFLVVSYQSLQRSV